MARILLPRPGKCRRPLLEFTFDQRADYHALLSILPKKLLENPPKKPPKQPILSVTNSKRYNGYLEHRWQVLDDPGFDALIITYKYSKSFLISTVEVKCLTWERNNGQ